jgi:hypothetical protein
MKQFDWKDSLEIEKIKYYLDFEELEKIVKGMEN